MSTKKRVGIVLLIYLCVSLLYLGLLAIGSASFFADPKLSRTYTYSLFFPLYCVVCGIFTRILSCRKRVLLISMCANLVQLIFSLYKFRLVYKLNYGIQNLGISYVVVAYALLLVGYAGCSLIIFLIYRYKSRKSVRAIAKKQHKQHNIGEAMLLKAYNKKNNRNERYLVWKTKSGKTSSSEAIIYYDPVELIAVDSQHRVYTFVGDPVKIKMKEYLSMISTTQ
jgi:hypothetical protein